MHNGQETMLVNLLSKTEMSISNIISATAGGSDPAFTVMSLLTVIPIVSDWQSLSDCPNLWDSDTFRIPLERLPSPSQPPPPPQHQQQQQQQQQQVGVRPDSRDGYNDYELGGMQIDHLQSTLADLVDSETIDRLGQGAPLSGELYVGRQIGRGRLWHVFQARFAEAIGEDPGAGLQILPESPDLPQAGIPEHPLVRDSNQVPVSHPPASPAVRPVSVGRVTHQTTPPGRQPANPKQHPSPASSGDSSAFRADTDMCDAKADATDNETDATTAPSTGDSWRSKTRFTHPPVDVVLKVAIFPARSSARTSKPHFSYMDMEDVEGFTEMDPATQIAREVEVYNRLRDRGLEGQLAPRMHAAWEAPERNPHLDQVSGLEPLRVSAMILERVGEAIASNDDQDEQGIDPGYMYVPLVSQTCDISQTMSLYGPCADENFM